MTRHNRLRIAHIAPQLNMGGLERLLVEFAKHARREQFDLQFVSLGERGSLAGDIEREGWRVSALEMPAGLHLGAIWRLARFFRKNQIDVVHTHNNKSLLYAAPAARLGGIRRIVHTRHGQNYNCSRREQTAFRHVCRLTTSVVGVSQDSARMCREEGIAAHKVVTVCNAIDTSCFPYSGPRHDGPALMVGRLSAEKNVMLLMHALAIALREEPPLQLDIAGAGPCRSELQASAKSLGIDDHVTFLGESRDIESLLKRSSMFVLPSLTEGISLTLLEAMAVGIPVVATDVGGNSEVVLDQVTGCLVPSNDAERLAEAVLQIWRDPARAHRMGQAGHQRVIERYDIRRMVAQYEDLYRGVHPGSSENEAGTSRRVG